MRRITFPLDVGGRPQLDVPAQLATAFEAAQRVIDRGAMAELDGHVLLVGEDPAKRDPGREQDAAVLDLFRQWLDRFPDLLANGLNGFVALFAQQAHILEQRFYGLGWHVLGVSVVRGSALMKRRMQGLGHIPREPPHDGVRLH